MHLWYKVSMVAVNREVNMIISSSNTSRLEDHPGIYRLLMKGIFDAYVL